MKIMHIEDNQDIRIFLGFMRKEINSYYFDDIKSCSATSKDFWGDSVQYLPNKLKYNIKLNVKLNQMKSEMGRSFETIRRKKSKEFNLEILKGITISIDGLEITIKTKNVTYKTNLFEKILKDGIYTKAGIGMSRGKPYLIVYEEKRRHLTNRYISTPELNRRKTKIVKRELTRVASKLKKKENIQTVKKEFVMNLVNFLDNLNKTFCNVKFDVEGFKELSKLDITEIVESGENQALIKLISDGVTEFKKYLIFEFIEACDEDEFDVFSQLVV